MDYTGSSIQVQIGSTSILHCTESKVSLGPVPVARALPPGVGAPGVWRPTAQRADTCMRRCVPRGPAPPRARRPTSLITAHSPVPHSMPSWPRARVGVARHNASSLGRSPSSLLLLRTGAPPLRCPGQYVHSPLPSPRSIGGGGTDADGCTALAQRPIWGGASRARAIGTFDTGWPALQGEGSIDRHISRLQCSSSSGAMQMEGGGAVRAANHCDRLASRWHWPCCYSIPSSIVPCGVHPYMDRLIDRTVRR